MKVLILMGSPRLHGNTAELCKPFMEELTGQGAEVKYIELEKKTILPCKECYACQEVAGEYGCAQKDDMPAIAEEMLWADCIILATPIFAWYCTTKMKAILDRHYGFNKYSAATYFDNLRVLGNNGSYADIFVNLRIS